MEIKEIGKKIESLLKEVGLDAKENFLDKYPYDYGGEQQRIVIMGALIVSLTFNCR